MRELATENMNGASSSPTPPPPQALLERLKDYGQEDAFAFWDQLSADQQNFLIQEIEVFLSRQIISRSLTFSIHIAFISCSRKLVQLDLDW